jgi:hypothetical protein
MVEQCWCGKDLDIGRGQPTPTAVTDHPIWICPEHGVGYTWRARADALAVEVARLTAEAKVNASMLARQCDLAREAELRADVAELDAGRLCLTVGEDRAFCVFHLREKPQAGCDDCQAPEPRTCDRYKALAAHEERKRQGGE